MNQLILQGFSWILGVIYLWCQSNGAICMVFYCRYEQKYCPPYSAVWIPLYQRHLQNWANKGFVWCNAMLLVIHHEWSTDRS
jgi:hypothetical protein